MTLAPLPTGFMPSDMRTYDPDKATATPFGVNRFLGGVGQDICSCGIHRMPEKSSADIIDYTIDLTTSLSDTDDYIFSIEPQIKTITGTSYDLSPIMAGVLSKYLAVVIFASGPPALAVTVLCKITTVQGLCRVVPFVIPINSVTGATDPPDSQPSANALTLNGVNLTDDSGAYLVP